MVTLKVQDKYGIVCEYQGSIREFPRYELKFDPATRSPKFTQLRGWAAESGWLDGIPLSRLHSWGLCLYFEDEPREGEVALTPNTVTLAVAKLVNAVAQKDIETTRRLIALLENSDFVTGRLWARRFRKWWRQLWGSPIRVCRKVYMEGREEHGI